MYKIKVGLSNGKIVDIDIERPELIYGATAIMLKEINNKEVFAINPITKERMDIILGKENRFIIPMHDKIDYNLALERGLKFKLAVMPYFTGDGEEAVRSQSQTKYRHSIIAIIKNPKTGKYLCEDARGGLCRSFVLGGMEEEETIEEAAIREINEETGYKNIKISNVSKISVINHFYAGYKGNFNRFARLEIVFGELIDEEHIEISEEEKKKHTVKWLTKEELREFINVEHNLFALEILEKGEQPYLGEGIMNTKDENNYKTSEEVREAIIKEYRLN